MSDYTTRIYTVSTSPTFTFDLPFVEPSEIGCYLASGSGDEETVIQLVRGTDFTVETLSDYSHGAQITLIAGNNIPTLEEIVGQKLTIARIVELERGITLLPNSKLSAAALTAELEQIVRMAQQLEDRLRRCIAVPIGATTRTPEGILESIYASDRNAANSAETAAGHAGRAGTSATNAANSATDAAARAADAALAFARAKALAEQIGSTDFGIYAEYLAGSNPVFTSIPAGAGVDIDGVVTATVPIDPANGAYQTVVLTTQAAHKFILVPVHHRLEDLSDRDFIYLTVILEPGDQTYQTKSVYFQYEANQDPVFITSIQGCYQVMLLNLGTGGGRRWVIGNWGKLFDVQFTYISNN